MGWLDSLRNFADPGNEWMEEFRGGQWSPIGDVKLIEAHSRVSYSVESCCNWGGGDPVFVVLRSVDLQRLRTFYFGLAISMSSDEIRLYIQRTETIEGKFNDQKTFGPKVLSTRATRDLVRHINVISKHSETHTYFPSDDDNWVYRMNRLLD